MEKTGRTVAQMMSFLKTKRTEMLWQMTQVVEFTSLVLFCTGCTSWIGGNLDIPSFNLWCSSCPVSWFCIALLFPFECIFSLAKKFIRRFPNSFAWELMFELICLLIFSLSSLINKLQSWVMNGVLLYLVSAYTCCCQWSLTTITTNPSS